MKFDGLCAYTGTPLKEDWQVDHVIPKCLSLSPKYHGIIDHNDPRNLVPVQRIINHYKRSLSIMDFKAWYLRGLHERLKKLPKKTTSICTVIPYMRPAHRICKMCGMIYKMHFEKLLNHKGIYMQMQYSMQTLK